MKSIPDELNSMKCEANYQGNKVHWGSKLYGANHYLTIKIYHSALYTLIIGTLRIPFGPPPGGGPKSSRGGLGPLGPPLHTGLYVITFRDKNSFLNYIPIMNYK